MAANGNSTFHKAPALLQPYDKIVKCDIQDTHWGNLILYRDAVGVYSATPAYWSSSIKEKEDILYSINTQEHSW